MMNVSLVFLAAVALIGAATVNAGPIKKSTKLTDVLDAFHSSPPVPNDNELEEVMYEFADLVPQEESAAILREYLRNDQGFNDAAGFLFSEEFKEVVREINNIDDVIKFYDYLEEAGLNAYNYVNEYPSMLGLPPLEHGKRARSIKITGGADGYIADIKAILPLDKIKALHQEKLKTSPVFARFVEHLMSPRFQEIIDALRANEGFQKLLNAANEGGIHFKAIGDLYATMLGIEFHSNPPVPSDNELEEVMYEFADLVPQEESAAILREYLRNDQGFNDAAGFLFSEEFKEVVREINNIDDVIKFYDYLEEAGLNAYNYVNEYLSMLGLPPLEHGKRARSIKITGGADGYIADIKAILPLDKIKALHQEKLKTSPVFARFVEHLMSPRFQEIIDALRANEGFQKLLNAANEGGIHFKAIGDLYATMLGIEFHSNPPVPSDNELEEVMNEFAALLPEKKAYDIFLEYLIHDQGFNDAAGFLMGEEFKEVARKINKIDDVIKFYDYLEEAGLHAYGLVNEYLSIIGLPPLEHGRHARSVKITGGADGYIADIKAILPLDVIKALHQEKLKTSPAFARFIEHLMSPRFQEIIDALRANAEFQNLLEISKEGGIHMKAIADLYATMLGIEFPDKSLF